MKNVALFDWDKTVRKGGYVIFDFIDTLVENSVIDNNVKNEISAILTEHSGGKITYANFTIRAVQIYRQIY